MVEAVVGGGEGVAIAAGVIAGAGNGVAGATGVWVVAATTGAVIASEAGRAMVAGGAGATTTGAGADGGAGVGVGFVLTTAGASVGGGVGMGCGVGTNVGVAAIAGRDGSSAGSCLGEIEGRVMGPGVKLALAAIGTDVGAGGSDICRRGAAAAEAMGGFGAGSTGFTANEPLAVGAAGLAGAFCATFTGGELSAPFPAARK